MDHGIGKTRFGAWDDERMRTHADAHSCPEDTPAKVLTCPCGTTYAITCADCGEAVFMSLEPGTFCEHAAWLMDPDHNDSGPEAVGWQDVGMPWRK